jgi:broad specificity phosphatase PhoE
VHTGLLNTEQFRRWREAYEAAGIAADEIPPPELCTTALNADVLIASDAPRAIASANLLAPGREVVISPLLRELELSPPDLGRLRLPLFGWALMIGVSALFRRPPVPAEEVQRTRAAANWLSEMAEERGTVLVVTHASVRRLVAWELGRLAWTREGRGRGMGHWSAWGFGREEE